MAIADVIKDIVGCSTNNFTEVNSIKSNDVVIRTNYILLNSSITDTVKVIVTSEDNVASTLE